VTSFVDEGVVLRRVDYADTDRILTVLTRTHGKLGVIARGVRKAGARMTPHTDLFARGSLQLTSGRGELLVLTQAQRMGRAPVLDDPRRATCAGLVAELADRVLEDGHPLEPEVYDLVTGALDGCGDVSRDPRAAVAWFARRIIDRLGYAPELWQCANCGERLGDAPHPFSAVGGGLLCPRCAPGDPGAVACSTAVIKVLRVIAAGDETLYARLRLTGAVLDTLEAVVERELEQHLDRRLRSFDVLRSLERHQPAVLPA
jgi:DNA repair protein RecO (recombination protein O)